MGCGGVYSDSSEASWSGHFAEDGFTKAANIVYLQVLDESNKLVPPEENLLHFFTDNPKCYTIAPFDTHDVHPAILYGGPGGNCAD
jgi:hypothetical protein